MSYEAMAAPTGRDRGEVEMPISLGWCTTRAERRKEEGAERSQAQGTSGSLAAGEGLQVPLVVSVQEPQLRFAGGAEGEVWHEPHPRRLIAREQLKRVKQKILQQRTQLINLDEESGAWSTWEKQELSYKGQHPQISWNHLLLSSSMHPRGLLHSDAMLKGRERKSPDETHEEQYTEIPAFGTWIKSPDFSLGSHYHS